jgi:hypothetical protein
MAHIRYKLMATTVRARGVAIVSTRMEGCAQRCPMSLGGSQSHSKWRVIQTALGGIWRSGSQRSGSIRPALCRIRKRWESRAQMTGGMFRDSTRLTLGPAVGPMRTAGIHERGGSRSDEATEAQTSATAIGAMSHCPVLGISRFVCERRPLIWQKPYAQIPTPKEPRYLFGTQSAHPADPHFATDAKPGAGEVRFQTSSAH